MRDTDRPTVLTLYRGLSVPADRAEAVMADIRTNGLRERGSGWRTEQHRPADPAGLFHKHDLTRRDTRDGGHIPAEPAVCACGDEAGAAHYAWRHNRTDSDDTPVLVAFTAPVEAVAVDGKDLLYTVFGRGLPDRAVAALERLYGPAMRRYAERALVDDDMSRRMALCDLAAYDPMVVLAHHANRTVVGGRNRLVFRSAFTVRLPIAPDAVVRVWAPAEPPPPATPRVRLDELIY